MNTRKLDEGSRWLGSISWSAVIAGAFAALAVESVLLLFGLAVAGGAPGGGFAVWALIVQIVTIGGGAALAAAITHPDVQAGGIAAGVMTWAVALVVEGIANSFAISARMITGSAWAAFFGALLALGAAIVGGRYGASIGGAPRGSVTDTLPDGLAAHPGRL